ncbi:MAG: hypothetical protein WBM83_16170 [Flavobacteriaceae bacterium]
MDTLCKKLLLVALMLAFGQGISAQSQVAKKVAKTYAMTDRGELQLENKYGNINLFGWNKNEVSVVMNIKVNHKKKETAEDLLNRINPVIRNGDDFVSISYEIAEKSSGFFANLFEKANPFDFNRSNLQIDYTVYMPSKAELKVTNTFGDVIIEDWTGNLRAKIEHGDLWMNEDLGKADIDVEYGKLKAKSINYANLTIINGELDMSDSKNLRLNSSGSDITLENVTSLEIYSNKDEVAVDEVGTIYGTLKFTTLALNHLKTSVDLNLRVADFRVSEILDPKADISIEQESSEISLNITDFPHRFDATLEEGLVRLPKSFENVDSRMLDEGKRLREIKATYGKELKGKISITGKKGAVMLKEF